MLSSKITNQTRLFVTKRFKIVNYKSNRNAQFLNQAQKDNNFLQYVQSLNPEMIAQLSKPESAEVLQVMEHNIVGMLGSLPAEHFNTMITTSRESLGRLLISAMMSGYFLRNAEQRMDFEQAFFSDENDHDDQEDTLPLD